MYSKDLSMDHTMKLPEQQDLNEAAQHQNQRFLETSKLHLTQQLENPGQDPNPERALEPETLYYNEKAVFTLT